MYSENQIEIFVLISSISLAVFILLTVYFIVRLKLKDIELKKSKKQIEKHSNNLENLVEKRTSQLMEKERSYKNLYEINKGILENSPAGIIRLDKNFHVTYENPEIKRILRVAKNEDSNLMNKDIRKVAPVKNSKKVGVFDQLLYLEEIDTEFSIKSECSLTYLTIRGVPLIEEDEFAGAVILVNDITKRKKAEAELNKAFESAIKILSDTLEIRDAYTVGHQMRVSQLTAAIADEMDIPKKQKKGLVVASIIHDVGKIKVPSEILSKPGNLNDIEFSYLKEHPTVGYKLLKGVNFPWPVAKIVYQHHERLDGSGYPKGLKKDKIMLESQILAVADVVEAMSSHRPYRPSLGIEAAMHEININKGKLYSKKIVKACQNVIESGFEFQEVDEIEFEGETRVRI